VTLKAYIFPYINFVWIGLIVMAAGFILSITRRAKAKPVVSLVSLLLLTGVLFYMFLIAN
jgi:cytochrome c-type biogenesis protein CcmF